MRGPTGTSVRLTLHRAENTPPQVVALTRSIVKLHPVQARAEGDVGYIRLTTFNERTASEMEDAIAKFKQTLGPRFAGLVLDLRNDPGGLLDQAIAVSDDFIDSGQIVAVRGRRSVEGRSYEAGGDNLIPGLPIVVLINGGSASASEIVTAALQDHRRALVFGTRSYGKGSVQTVSPLPDGGALRLTTARYYRPAGTSVDCVGVNPDLEIKPTPPPGGRTEEPHQDPATCAGNVQPAPQPPSLRMSDICPGIEEGTPLPETTEAKGAKDGKTPVRTIHDLRINAVEGGAELVFEGTSFLMHQVRIMAGTLVEVGRGRRSVDSLAGVLQARDRTRAGLTAPPQGLCLERVWYESKWGVGDPSPWGERTQSR